MSGASVRRLEIRQEMRVPSYLALQDAYGASQWPSAAHAREGPRHRSIAVVVLGIKSRLQRSLRRCLHPARAFTSAGAAVHPHPHVVHPAPHVDAPH
jgi:hypothetical protein